MRQVRVLLLYSSDKFDIISNNNIRVAPIGLFFINGYLTKKGFSTKIKHVTYENLIGQSADSLDYKKKLTEEMADYNPDFIGYSFRNLFHWGFPEKSLDLVSYLSVSRERVIINFIREITNAKIIGGGPAFSIAPKLYMNHLNLDYGIIGEGEISFFELLSGLFQSKDVLQVPGLIFKKDGRFVINPFKYIAKLDNMPEMETGEFENFYELYCENNGFANIQTKRGCSFNCIYCQYPYLEGKKYRLRNINHIINEIINIQRQFKVDRFFFVDSVFSTPWEHSAEICKQIIDRKIKIEWISYINPRNITFELLELYKKAGCKHLIFTPDSLSDTVLRMYRKDFNMNDVKSAILELKRAKISFEVSLILGGIGETEATVDETIRFCDVYLNNIQTDFFCGMWIHPEAHAMEVLKKENFFAPDEKVEFDKIVESNDFIANNKLTYFFPQIKENRQERLNVMIKKVEKNKRKIIGNFLS
jgi:radical SAM superfamily enzyme YgiQ (UPF0313 family)